MANNALVWFRRDLRRADNPALLAASDWAREQGGRLLAVYIDDQPGAWAEGAASRWWLHHSLAAFAASLNALGNGLHLRRGVALTELRSLIDAADIGAVFWNRLYEPELIERDRTIKSALRDAGVAVESFNGGLLNEPWELRTKSGGPYKVFTPFSKAQREFIVAEPLPSPAALPPPPELTQGLALADLRLLPTLSWDAGFIETWKPGESSAMAMLDDFADGPVARYQAERDLPARPATSRLSAALHFGEISPRQAWHAAQSAQGEAAEPWLRQIQWREFAHHLLFHFPHTATEPLNPAYASFPWRDDYAADLAAWQRGQTGIPIVDAGMRELWHTGWMHNRVRMLVASLLTKNLLIPWQEGARWFWDTLVDADLPNNTLGWQWTAGCGADAAPYFRIFNPVTQGEKFDPDGRYVRRWLPELKRLPDKWLHKPWQAPAEILRGSGVSLGASYPAPIVDLAESRQIALDLWANEVRGRH
ncbi:MAG: deoxyribodipyrimidine photo-lyase [Chromatiales bacterium]|nr:deoxyribodipyrimidine photo-lyase [Chromatiales bacterium]